MLGHFIPPINDFEPFMAEPIQPVPNDYFIWWLFKHKCVMCRKPATCINEIIPRGRTKKSILDWRNRVTLCTECHLGDKGFHHKGVTQEKISEMQQKRKEFLISIGRIDYL